MIKKVVQRVDWTWYYFYLLANAALFIIFGFIFSQYVWPHGLPQAAAIWICTFLSLASIGHFSLLAILTSLPGLLAMMLWPKARIIYKSIFVLFLSWASYALLVDLLVYHSYRFHLNGVILALFFSKAGYEIFDFSLLEWLTAGLAFIGFFLLQVTFIYLATFLSNKLSKAYYTTTFSGIAFLSLIGSYLMFTLSAAYPKMEGYFSQQPQALPLYNSVLSFIAGSNAQDVLRNAGFSNYYQPGKEAKLLNYPLKPLQCKPKRLPNIVVIVIDTWRFDALTPKITPNIYRFSQHALEFKNHRSGGNGTQPGIFSLFYSLPGTYWSAMTQQNRAPVFFDELRKHHYQFGIYASAPLTAPAFNKNVFLNIPKLALETKGEKVDERDKKITTKFLDFLKQRDQRKPFFGFVFYDAAHSFCLAKNVGRPFKPVIGECARLYRDNETDPVPYFHRYWNALYQIDNQVNMILYALQQQGILNNTIVVITGDHGQEFNDTHHNFWGHAGNFTKWQLNTPFLVYWPGYKPQLLTYETSHYDFVPTMMQHVFNCSEPADQYGLGKSLFSPHPAEYFLATGYINFAVVEPQKITTVYTDSLLVTDQQAESLYNARLNPEILRAAFDDMQRFYQR